MLPFLSIMLQYDVAFDIMFWSFPWSSTKLWNLNWLDMLIVEKHWGGISLVSKHYNLPLKSMEGGEDKLDCVPFICNKPHLLIIMSLLFIFFLEKIMEKTKL